MAFPLPVPLRPVVHNSGRVVCSSKAKQTTDLVPIRLSLSLRPTRGGQGLGLLALQKDKVDWGRVTSLNYFQHHLEYILLKPAAQRGAVKMGLVKETDPHTRERAWSPPRYHDGGAVESVLKASANMSWEDWRNQEVTLKSNQSFSFLLHKTTWESYWRGKYVSCF